QDNLITTTYLQRRQLTAPAGQGSDQLWLGDHLLWNRPSLGNWQPESDEEIAAASVLDSLVRWLRGEGPDPHSLADALWEARLGLAVSQAAQGDHEISLERSH
ncbi:MAG: hypothetical protein LBE83_01835, partial [Propionibacteriaceae bacterium]|nr:hypothetical protein [Propionibacteriaceae bacterium]